MTNTARPVGRAETKHLRVANAVRKRTAYERFFKRPLDLAAALALSLLTLPAVFIISLIVLVDLGNPVLLRQDRVGRNGKVFRVWKFRTMRPDRRAPHGPAFVGTDRRVNHKSGDDPRLTTLGRFLRKWSLDELPQLWNVVAGQMSLVGPRPELTQIVDAYQPWQHARHEVRPGVTGLWQVSARGEVPMHEATHIDLEYTDRITLRRDLRILMQTIPAALGVRTGL